MEKDELEEVLREVLERLRRLEEAVGGRQPWKRHGRRGFKMDRDYIATTVVVPREWKKRVDEYMKKHGLLKYTDLFRYLIYTIIIRGGCDMSPEEYIEKVEKKLWSGEPV